MEKSEAKVQAPWEGHCEDVLFTTVAQPFAGGWRWFWWACVAVIIGGAIAGAVL